MLLPVAPPNKNENQIKITNINVDDDVAHLLMPEPINITGGTSVMMAPVADQQLQQPIKITAEQLE